MAFPFLNKAPSVNILEGDPPIGKERGALGVGTGPTPPHTPAISPPRAPTITAESLAKIQLRAPNKDDHPRKKRRQPVKKEMEVQKTKITSMFQPKNKTTPSQSEDNLKRKEDNLNGQTHRETEGETKHSKKTSVCASIPSVGSPSIAMLPDHTVWKFFNFNFND